MLGASELVLAYLSRSNADDRLQLSDNIVKELILKIDTLLSDMKEKSETYGDLGYMHLDGCKRIYNIAWLLKNK